MTTKNCENCEKWMRSSIHMKKPKDYDFLVGYCLGESGLNILTPWNQVCESWEKKRGITLYLDIRMVDPIGVDADNLADGLRKLADEVEKVHLDEEKFVHGYNMLLQAHKHSKK